MRIKHYLYLIVLLTLVLAACSSDLSVELEVPPEKLQKKLNEEFPISAQEQEESLPFEVILSDPEVILEEGNDQLGVRFTSTVTPPEEVEGGLPLPGLGLLTLELVEGKVTIFVSLTYAPEEKAIYMSEPKITELDFELLPDILSDPVSRLIEQELAKKFAEEPVFLPEDERLLQAATPVLKSITVKDGKLLLEFGL